MTKPPSRQEAMKASASAGSTPAFRGSSPVLTSMKQPDAPPWTRHLAPERLGELRAVQRLDDVKQRDRLLDLVGLQRADQMKFDAGVPGLEIAEFSRRLLHTVLAEQALASGEGGGNGIGTMGLAYRHQRYGRYLSPGGRQRRRLCAP